MKKSAVLLVVAVLFLVGKTWSQDVPTSTAIPAIKSLDASWKAKKALPFKPLDASNRFGSFKPSEHLPTAFEKSQKTFSLYQEPFGNSGASYERRARHQLASVKNLEEPRDQGDTVDRYLGDFRSTATSVTVSYRDFGLIDGDRIDVLVNDTVVGSNVLLTGIFKSITLKLQKGFNKIDFLALNQGRVGANTAELVIVDNIGRVVSENRWQLATGIKATIIIVKE